MALSVEQSGVSQTCAVKPRIAAVRSAAHGVGPAEEHSSVLPGGRCARARDGAGLGARTVDVDAVGGSSGGNASAASTKA